MKIINRTIEGLNAATGVADEERFGVRDSATIPAGTLDFLGRFGAQGFAEIIIEIAATRRWKGQ